MLLLALWPRSQRWLSPFGWAGRMAFTNYLLQALVVDYLSAPYGLALKVRPWWEIGGGLLLFGALAGLSWLWLARFRFGPMEWAWRSVTYWRWPSRRREPGVAAPIGPAATA